GFDPYASFQFSENGQNDTIDPDSVQWAAIRYRTAAQYNEDNVEYISQFYVYPPAEPFIPVHYNYSGEWETVIVDMTSVAALYGRESIWNSTGYTDTRYIRLDPLEPDRDADNFDDSTGRGKVIEGDYIDIAWIAFFESEADAKAYTGTEDTPYCLLDTGSLSSTFSVHSLKAEYISEKPVDPAATDAPVEIPGPGALFALNYEDELNDLLFAGNKNIIEEVYFEDNCYKIDVPAGSDPNLELCFGSLVLSGDIEDISADDNKIIQLGVRVNTEEGGGVVGNLYWQTDLHPGYSEPQDFEFKYQATTDIQVVNLDFTRIKNWEGWVSNLRYDPFSISQSDTQVELYYIAFFPNMESAEAFGAQFLAEGLPATPVPTEKPTAAPTAAPTEAPVVTDAPTDAPKPTDAPPPTNADNTGDKDNASDNTPKKGLSTGAVVGIVIGAVAVAAVICGIVISKAGKKK
ncbi:MAG: hypothetical protein J5584_03720, partial [Clostridia bacterium]|nr:hypothetical protein [Clostridia bacterium]